MKVVVGAPVAARDWALPSWFEYLYAQTRPPDEFVFVVKNVEGDRSKELLHELGPKPPKLSYAIDQTRYVPRMDRNRVGPSVYSDFAWRRNRLLQMVQKRDPDVFISIDTDMMLEDPTTIARLLALLKQAPVAAPLTYLHPWGAQSECYNAGYWHGGEPGSPERPWARATGLEAEGIVPIQIPMAVVAMRRQVVDACKYAYHECGEDMGFAQDLDRLKYECLWDTECEVHHVMSREELCVPSAS